MASRGLVLVAFGWGRLLRRHFRWVRMPLGFGDLVLLPVLAQGDPSSAGLFGHLDLGPSGRHGLAAAGVPSATMR